MAKKNASRIKLNVIRMDGLLIKNCKLGYSCEAMRNVQWPLVCSVNNFQAFHHLQYGDFGCGVFSLHHFDSGYRRHCISALYHDSSWLSFIRFTRVYHFDSSYICLMSPKSNGEYWDKLRCHCPANKYDVIESRRMHKKCSLPNTWSVM